jgi:hypothetical protein
VAPPKRLPVKQMISSSKELNLKGAQVFHLPDWDKLTHPERLALMRQISMARGRDPRIVNKALAIIRKAGVQPREYEKQAASLLAWVQNPKNVYYVNEAGERLQDPIYTLNVKIADCDDMVLLLCALFESIGLPWKYVLSGRDAQGNKIRYIEGEPVPPGCVWTHIYCMVGTPPFRPTMWFFCEPTLQKVPLGWDVVDGDASYLPEMSNRHRGAPMLARPGKAPVGFKPPRIPTGKHRSPAYDMAYGDAYGVASYAANNSASGTSMAIGAGVAESVEQTKNKSIYWSQLAVGIFTGVAVSVGTTMVLNWIHGKGLWEGRGTILDRVK